MSAIKHTIRETSAAMGMRGRPALLGNNQGDIFAGNGRYWVREIFAGRPMLPIAIPTAANVAVTAQLNLAVRIGLDGRKRMVILGHDAPAQTAQGYDPYLNNPLLPRPLEKAMFQPLRCRPSQSPVRAMFAEVLPDIFVINGLPHWWTGGDIDLSGEIPSSGNHCYTVVFYRLSSDALEIGSSTPQATSSALDVTDISEAITDNGHTDVLSLRAFELIGDMTALDDDLTDNPDLRTVVNSGGGGGGTPSDTVTDETALGIAPAAGVATEYSRGDHTHGSPGPDLDIDQLLVEKDLHINGEITPTAFSGTRIDDYNPTGLADATVIRQDASLPTDISGLAGGAAGRVILFENISSTEITILAESSHSTSANQFESNMSMQAALVIHPNCAVLLRYDTHISRWRFEVPLQLINDVPGVLLASKGGTGTSLVSQNDVLVGDVSNVWSRVNMGASTILARLASGNVIAATVAQIKTLLAIVVADISDFTASVNSLITTALAIATGAFDVTNASGGTVAANDAGFIDSDGKFYTTTTAGIDGSRCAVVVTGGANGATITVRNTGKVTISYTGSAPNAGDTLITSTSAKQVSAQAYYSPATMAVALAAGSGGTVSALLLTQRPTVPATSSSNIYAVSAGATSVWTGSINGAPSATSVVVTTSTGNLNCVTPSGTLLGYARLYNTTRNNYRLISSISGSTITTLSSTDNWANTDALTIESRTITSGATAKFIDIDLTQSAALAAIPANAVQIISLLFFSDTGTITSAQKLTAHPLETFSATKGLDVGAQVTSISNRLSIPLGLTNRLFGIQWTATGNTATPIVRLAGYVLAAP